MCSKRCNHYSVMPWFDPGIHAARPPHGLPGRARQKPKRTALARTGLDKQETLVPRPHLASPLACYVPL